MGACANGRIPRGNLPVRAASKPRRSASGLGNGQVYGAPDGGGRPACRRVRDLVFNARFLIPIQTGGRRMARAAPQRDDRRGRIATALYRCIKRQGYANTSLANVADEAGMSPSHVGYYLDNKAAILEYYAAAICELNLAALPDPGERDLERLLDELARFCLGEGQTSTGMLGVVQELTGLAVHDPRLHKIKARHATAWREYLESVFERAKCPLGVTAREAAWLVHAILVGLNTNALFDRALDRERAHALFRGALRALAGLDAARPGAAARIRVPRKRGRR